ncbi:mitochondrial import inner membrane translocase subunit Tim9 [Culicoides brevitarsis]|uniref:mitochondrial import inner membrane translocase subunit Tim9 n=1 Tax=Culicoides brevitarsis TaxID=469753 RepID=UPI00307B589B
MASSGLEGLDTKELGTLKEFLMQYSKLTELCFADCVTDFTSRTIKPEEERCSLTCTEKFLKMNQRISQRFQEFQMISNENILAAQNK